MLNCPSTITGRSCKWRFNRHISLFIAFLANVMYRLKDLCIECCLKSVQKVKKKMQSGIYSEIGFRSKMKKKIECAFSKTMCF